MWKECEGAAQPPLDAAAGGDGAAGELLRDLRVLEKLDPVDSSSSAMAGGRRTRRVSRDFEGLADDFAILGMDDMAVFYRALADRAD